MSDTNTIAYGPGRIQLPDACRDWPRLEAAGLSADPDPAVRIAEGCRDAAARAASHLGGSEMLAVVVPDRTRPMPLERYLPALLEALREAGVPPRRIALVPASGIHRPMPLDELSGWVGDAAAASGIELVPHDADQPGLPLGTTASGIPVSAHPHCVHAGAVLSLGRIVFHYLAGYGGGRKMLAPGVSARKTILAVHGRCLADPPERGRHPRARAGVLEDNPVHRAACEVAGQFPPTVAMHVALARSGELAWVRVGDPVHEHARAAEAYGSANLAEVDGLLDAVVVSAGGHPVDRDLVQAHKALDAVSPIVRDGGSIVLVAEGRDGVGNPEVVEGLVLETPERIETALRNDFRVGVHTALALAEKTRRFEVLAVTHLHDELLEAAGIHPVASLEEALERVQARHGTSADAAIAPRGASLMYRLAQRDPRGRAR
jgi:nickel-dependent lactate racemase